MRRLSERGVRHFKCATTLELATACEAGAADVLLAYPAMGANAQRARAIAADFPGTSISVLVETVEQARQWRGSRLGIFLDLNPGMNRTGIPQEDTARILALAKEIAAGGLRFRGLHYYDGHLGGLEMAERTAAAHRGYDRLLRIADELSRSGLPVEEVITAGTPSFPCTVSYAGFRRAPFAWRASPGTVVYCDATSLAQLPAELGYRPAALVISRVVSHPQPDTVTCDAGHKSVSADAGVPTCAVLGHPELQPCAPSEEHLPMTVTSGAPPAAGELLYLVPRHVCPTVNNFDYALIVRRGVIEAVEKVNARGREMPLLQSTAAARP
jgi:D-serine deaminase-like pyridoxal phosphate-dependent protein